MNTNCGDICAWKKNTTKIKIGASQRISNMNCMNYDHNKMFGLFKFQSGYRKFYLNSPKGYSRKIIYAQTEQYTVQLCLIRYLIRHRLNRAQLCWSTRIRTLWNIRTLKHDRY